LRIRALPFTLLHRSSPSNVLLCPRGAPRARRGHTEPKADAQCLPHGQSR
jgi:hypothetical protein